MSNPFSLYMHFPYCWSKCSYCAFNSIRYDKDQSQRFLGALKSEISLYGRDPKMTTRTVSTIFMGGGTPTIFSADQLLDVLDHARSSFSCEPGLEITVEANPGTVDSRKLASLRLGGVNRLSLGVESFRTDDLEFLGRAHSPGTARRAYQEAREAGFENINLDFINGLPGQSLEQWKVTLYEAMALRPEHLAVYSLTPEEGTPIGELNQAGRLNLPREDDALLMDQWTHRALEAAGFGRYEVSNFSQPGRECRHNLGYWEDREYLGFGPGAHSFFDGRRFSNREDIPSYIEAVEKESLPVEDSEEMLGKKGFYEALAFGLRKTRGISFGELFLRHGPVIEGGLWKKLELWTEAGLMVQEGDALRLSEKGIRLWDLLGEEILSIASG